MKRLIVLALLVWLSLTCPSRADKVRVTGRVVDAEGRPVDGAEVSRHWYGDDSALKGLTPTVTDRDGRFTAEVDFFGEGPQVLLAYDARREHGGVVAVAKDQANAVSITLSPLVRVHGKFDCSELGGPPGWTNVYFGIEPGFLRCVQQSSRRGEFDVKLPAGHYQFDGYADFTDYEGVKKTVDVKAAEAELDMGTIDLKAAPLARHYGKAPPGWHVTDARGAPKDVTLDHYRGKWVLIEFWGFW
jgi:hypothetical protein